MAKVHKKFDSYFTVDGIPTWWRASDPTIIMREGTENVIKVTDDWDDVTCGLCLRSVFAPR